MSRSLFGAAFPRHGVAGRGRRQPIIVDEHGQCGAGLPVLDRGAAGLVEIALDIVALVDDAAGQPLQQGVALRGIDEKLVAAADRAFDLSPPP